MQTWAARELQTLDLGDARRTRRVHHLVDGLVARPQASLPDACQTWAASKAAYRLLDNPAVTPEAIQAAHVDATVARLAGQARVLVMQDTTSLDYSQHPVTQGLGPLEHPASRGLKVHSALTVSVAGVPYGLAWQHVWVRIPPQWVNATSAGSAPRRTRRVSAGWLASWAAKRSSHRRSRWSPWRTAKRISMTCSPCHAVPAMTC